MINFNGIDSYRLNNEYNISEILSHFGSEYIIDILEDKLNNIDYASTLIEPNFVGAFESKFKLMYEQFPGDSQNITSVRNEVYTTIIDILCKKFNLEFNTRDENIDKYTAAYYLFEFLVCERNKKMVDFFTAFIINNKDSLYDTINIDDNKKHKDSSTAYSKRMFNDAKYIAISANITSIINYITNLDITLLNIFQSTYVDYKVVLFLDNAFQDKGNFFKDFYCKALNNIESQPVIITNIRLSLHNLVGDINGASYINEIIASSPKSEN